MTEYREWAVDNAQELVYEKYHLKFTYISPTKDGVYLGGYPQDSDDGPRLFFVKYDDWSIRELK